MTERTHVAKTTRPIEVGERVQSQRSGYKPKGLWYEIDGDWRRWCADEMVGWVDGHYVHRLTLGAEDLLILASAAELDAFTEQYASGRGVGSDALVDGIDWRRVAARWDGIEIAPYQWTRRLDLMWYYGWDCASGCIWRPRGAALDLIESAPLALVPA